MYIKFQNMMKTMKSLGFSLIFLAVFTAFVSCSKDEYHSRLPELIVKDMTFEQGAQTKEQVFRNEDLSNFSAISDQDWCVPQVDIQNSKITISVRANDTYDARTAKVTITDTKDNTTRSFTVSQAQFDEIKIEGDLYEVEMEGGEVAIEVKSNVSFTVQVEDVDWIKYTSTRGLESSTVLLSVSKNNSGGERAGVVRILNSDKEIEKTATIRQKFTPEWNIAQSSFTLDELGQEIAVRVQTNFQLDLYVYDPWIIKGEKETVDGDGTYNQTFKVSAFTEKKESRTSQIVFENLTYDKSHTINVTQMRTFYIPKESMAIIAGDSLIVDLKNTKKREVKWESSDPTIATVNQSGMVKGVGDGTARITATSTDGKYSDYISIVSEKPKDLYNYLSYDWQSTYKSMKKEKYTDGHTEGDEVSVLSSVGCSMTNKSNFNIQLTKCTLYRDGKELRNVTFNDKGGAVAINESKKVSFDDLVIWVEKSKTVTVKVTKQEQVWVEDEPEEPSEEDDTETSETDTSTTETSTDTESTDPVVGDRNISRRNASTRAGHWETVEKEVEEEQTVYYQEVDDSEHSYSIIWDYTYNGAKFQYKCDEIKASTR